MNAAAIIIGEKSADMALEDSGGSEVGEDTRDTR